MNRVYFTKDFKELGSLSRHFLSEFYDSRHHVLVKLHFGEPKNKTALGPKNIAPIIKALKDLSLKPVLIDTPVAYSSPRGSVAGYKKVVAQRGFTKLAPVIISDKTQKVKMPHLTIGVCRELASARNVLVISHVKGHPCSGFGGAVKNLGMGGVSKETKKEQHALCRPKMAGQCSGCGICCRLCPAKAIKIIEGQAHFDQDKCWGCSICIVQCPQKCLRPHHAIFDELLAEAAAAVMGKLPKRTFYINLARNITRFCDCADNSGPRILPNIGMFFSTDPIAIDRCSVGMINKVIKSNIFYKINHKEPLMHVDLAARKSGYRAKSRLVTID